MKDYKIDLKSLKSLYEVNDKGEGNFILSYEGMQNFYDNFTIFVNEYENLKLKLKNIFKTCIDNNLDSNNGVQNIYNYLSNLEELSFNLSLSRIFKSKDINYFIDMNRKVIGQMFEFQGRLSIFLNDFNSVLNEEEQLKINLFTNVNTFEKNEGDWNVDFNKSIYYTNFYPFIIGYDYETLNEWVNSLIPSNNRELGFLLYDQAQIKNYLYNLNNFIEELKDKLLHCPLNFKTYETKIFEIKDPIPSGDVILNLNNSGSIEYVTNISMQGSSRFYITMNKTITPTISWKIETEDESRETILESSFKGNNASTNYYSGIYEKKSVSINKKIKNLIFNSSCNPDYVSVAWGTSSNPSIQIQVEYVSEFKVESFDY